MSIDSQIIKLNHYRFNSMVWLLVFGTLVSRLGTSMTTPFMSFFLHERAGMSLASAGIIIGSSFLAYAFGGFWGGAISDFLGRKFLLLGSLFLYALIFIGFGIASTNIQNIHLLGMVFVLLNIISGICRSWYESLTQAAIADFSSEEKKTTAFGLRYTGANIGTAIGPLLGTALGLSGSSAGFYLTGSILLLYFILFFIIISKNKQQCTTTTRKIPNSLKETIKILLQDRAMFWLTVTGILIYFGFVQQEALFAQIVFLKLHSLRYFSILIAINASLVIILQLPLSYLLNRFSPLNVIIGGAILISLGLTGIGNSGSNFFGYIVSEIIFTLGEILVFSFMSVMVDVLAPASLRGAYFGAASFQFLGRAIGPVIGGFFLQHLGANFSMSLIGLITATSVFSLWQQTKCAPAMKMPLPGE